MTDRNVSSSRRGYLGNLVVKIESYEPDSELQGCYPGLAVGVAMGGSLNGKRVRLAIRTTPTNLRTPKIADLASESHRSATPAGGYIGLNSVRRVGELCIGTWANRFAAPDAELRVGKQIQISPSLDRDKNVRRFRSNGATIYNAYIVHDDLATTSDSLAQLYESLSRCFSEHNAALLALIGEGDRKEPRRRTLTLWRGWRDGESLPLDEAVLRQFAEPHHTMFEEIVQARGKFDLLPMEAMTVGPVSGESIDRGMHHNVAIGSYMTGDLGGRLATALRQSKQEDRMAVENHLLAELDDVAKGAYSNSGWKDVQSSDLERQFERLGLSLHPVPSYGFATATAVLGRYGGEGDFFVAKARAQGACVPRSAIATPSDPNARSRHFNRFRRLVAEAAERIRARPEADAKAVERRLTIDDLQLPKNRLETSQSRPGPELHNNLDRAHDPTEPN
ncbi:MAG: hypothetical protein OXB95_11855 [Rhodobacteraceae bacterium]|nr:hypothetical protein [Paracoccaceae bacterium]